MVDVSVSVVRVQIGDVAVEVTGEHLQLDVLDAVAKHAQECARQHAGPRILTSGIDAVAAVLSGTGEQLAAVRQQVMTAVAPSIETVAGTGAEAASKAIKAAAARTEAKKP